MTARDHRGRFVSADEHAATRLLEAAVAEAVRLLRITSHPTVTLHGVTWIAGPDRCEVRRILTEAGNSADLLLRSER